MLDPVELFPEISNLYEFPSVHADMVFDATRVRSYESAIRRTVNPGDVVVDVGAGTGLLSFLCVKAGARLVYAIERSPILEWAKALARDNQMQDAIVFHNMDSRDVILPESADVVVSEIIGHLAFEEGLAEALVDAKSRFLRPGGTLIPGATTLYSALVHEHELYPTYIDGWGTLWGINYSRLREKACKTVYICQIPERDLLSRPQAILATDFSEVVDELDGKHFSYRVLRDGLVNGLAFWFDASLAQHVSLSSGPWVNSHWKQAFVPFERPLNVRRDEQVTVAISLKFRKLRTDSFSFSAVPVLDFGGGLAHK